MRTALLTTNYPPRPTGLGRAAEAIAEGLASQGVEVTVVSADRDLGSHERFGAVRLVGCAVPDRGARAFARRRMAVGHLVMPQAFAAAVRGLHRKAPFDLIEATNWYAPALFLAAPRARRTNNRQVPVVVRHSTPAGITTEAQSLRDRLDLTAAHTLERRAVTRAQGQIFNTAASRDVLTRHYRLKLRVPTAVIGLALSPALLTAGRTALMPAPDAPFTITFVGRAERRKGFVEALEGVAELAAERPVRLNLVGVEAQTIDETLAQLPLRASFLSGIISAHGRASDETLWRCYGESHAVLAPSRSESYGIVYREAAAFGRPVVASAEDASAREFIAATGAGVLAARTQGAGIAEALRTLAHDPRRAATCREAGLAHAATLTREALGAATLALYERVLTACGSAARAA